MQPKPEMSANESSIQVTTRNDRSLYMLLIHLLTRPLRSRLGRPKKYHPKGSLQLELNKATAKQCSVKHHTICDINVYDISRKTAQTAKAKKRIYYFNGGGWQSPPSSQHWQMCARLAREVPDAVVTLVSYPLAPNNPAPTAFPWMMRFYRTIMEAADEAGEEVVLAGDSSGGNIVLGLVLEAVREDSKTEHESRAVAHPVAVMVISPSTDLTRSNPDIQKLAPYDPLLTPPFVRQTAGAWQGEWDAADRRLSPVNADIALLAKSGIHVHGITGGYDILSPDGIIFRDKCAEEGVVGQWLHWEKQMHCFVLTQGYRVPEARAATEWMIKMLQEE